MGEPSESSSDLSQPSGRSDRANGRLHTELDSLDRIDDSALAEARVKAARIARFRTPVLLVVLLGLAVVLVWLLTYRPPPPRFSAAADTRPRDTAVMRSAVTVTDTATAKVVQPAAQPRNEVRSVFAGVQRGVDLFHGYVRRAIELLPVGDLDSALASDALERARAAPVLLDSAERSLAAVSSGSSEVRRVSRSLSGNDAYRVSILHVAIGRYLELLEEDLVDDRAYVAAVQAALLALGSGDSSEYEIKRDVANGHLGRLDARRRKLEQRAAQMNEAYVDAVR